MDSTNLVANKNVVVELEGEFRRALEGAETLTAFTRETAKLLGLVGSSNFSFFSWTFRNKYPADTYRSHLPKPLISNNSESTNDQALSYLLDVVSGKSNKGLLKAYYEETISQIDPPESSVRRGCYMLITNTGNYAYFVRKGGQTPNSRQLLCIVSKAQRLDQFRKYIEDNLLAFDSINRIVEEVGVERFPSLFSVSDTEENINIGSKPLRLLNIIALDDVTLNQAAEMLDISVDTANKHIAKIKSELGVATLPSAVFNAANKGLIDRVL